MEQPSTGYDFEVIGDTGKDFECQICMRLLSEPVELPCAHVFCKVCLEHWQDNPMEKDAAFLCPSCKKMYHREQVVNNKFLDRYVKTSLQVKCKVNKSGCQWEGKIIDYTQHEEKCIYKFINCNFVGCKERMIVMNQTKHHSECMYRSVQCIHCLLEVQFINIENHYKNCDEFPVNCPNGGCLIITPRKQAYNHTQNECPYQIVNCEYNTVGCKHQLQRRHTCEHQTQCLPDHMNMLLNRFNTTSQELSSVKEKLRQTDEKLQQTEERLQETEKRLHITEKILSITDENHQETKIILHQTQKELQNTNIDLLVAKENITKLINHDIEIDKLSFQLAKYSASNFSGKPFNLKKGLKSLDAMDYNEISEFNINSPDVWSDLNKMLEEKVNVSYTNRFIDVMDIMETKKLYRSGEKEVFVKIDVTNYTMINPSFTDYDSFQSLKNNGSVVFSSENILLRELFGICIQIIFAIHGWKDNNAKIYLLDPTNSNPILLISQECKTIYKNMAANNTVIVKGILQ